MREENNIFYQSNSNYITHEDYFKLKEKSLIKYEYQNGQIWNIPPENDDHVTITCNLYKLLHEHLFAENYHNFRLYIGDRHVYIKERNCYYYPDILITYKKTICDQCPQLIIEVTSEKTEQFDREKKMRDYQTLETLKEYILVNTTSKKIECFRRKNNNLWFVDIYTPEKLFFQFKSIDFQGELKKIYQGI